MRATILADNQMMGDDAQLIDEMPGDGRRFRAVLTDPLNRCSKQGGYQ